MTTTGHEARFIGGPLDGQKIWCAGPETTDKNFAQRIGWSVGQVRYVRKVWADRERRQTLYVWDGLTDQEAESLAREALDVK